MKKTISYFLILCLFLTILPFTIFADEPLPKGGLIPDSLETILDDLNCSTSYLSNSMLLSSIPSSKDLTSEFPTPGNQGQQNSCVGWAVAYALKSHQEHQQYDWEINNSTHEFSPSYVYNQINNCVDNGSSISTALNLIKYQGVCTLSDMPYNENNYTTQPTISQRKSASNFQAISYSSISYGDTYSMKSQISQGEGVVISVPMYDDLTNLNYLNDIYDNSYGASRGRHAICLIGYDDSMEAFKFINSWGTSWGLNGYGWISYDFVEDQNNYVYGYTMIDNTSPPSIEIQGNTTTLTNNNVSIKATAKNAALNNSTLVNPNDVDYHFEETHIFTENGNYTFSAVDFFGTTITREVIINNIDKTPPDAPQIIPNITTPTTDDVIITIISPQNTICKYSIDGGLNWATYAQPICFNNNGSIIVKAIDEAGNYSEQLTYNITNIVLPFIFNSSTGTITGYTGTKANLYIPSSINGVSVTNIGTMAFYNLTTLTSVTIPNSVTNISDFAFLSCSALTNVSIPNSVINIGGSAFAACNVLTTITIPNGITTIGMYAFSGCNGLTSVTIPNSVTSIGYSAFLPSDNLVIYCHSDSFAHTYADSNNIKHQDLDKFIFNASNGTITGYTGTEANIYIPSNINGVAVTNIGSFAFCNLVTLISVKISNGVTNISDFAFLSCSALTNVKIPNSVTNIGGSAFAGCNALTNVTIPNSVTSIGFFAFSIDELVIYCNSNSFAHTYADSNNIKHQDLDKFIFNASNGTITGYTGTEANIYIPSSINGVSVTNIGTMAFYNLTTLTSVKIPNSVTNISDFAFLSCSVLTNVSIPNSVINIGGSAFAACNALTTITIPNGITTIGMYAFSGCNGLTSVTIPNSVTSIGYSAFLPSDNLVIYCHSDSFAHTYADNNNLTHQII